MCHGVNKVSADLGVVSVGKNKNVVEVAILTVETNINTVYKDIIPALSAKLPKVKQKVDPVTKQDISKLTHALYSLYSKLQLITARFPVLQTCTENRQKNWLINLT